MRFIRCDESKDDSCCIPGKKPLASLYRNGKEGCEVLLGNKDLTLRLLHTGQEKRCMHFVSYQMVRPTDGDDLLDMLIGTFQFIAFIGDGSQTKQSMTEPVRVPVLSYFRHHLPIQRDA